MRTQIILLSIVLFSTQFAFSEAAAVKPEIPHMLWPIPSNYTWGKDSLSIKDPCNFSFNFLSNDTIPQIPQLISLYRRYMFKKVCRTYTIPTTPKTKTEDPNSLLNIYIANVRDYLMNTGTDETYNLHIRDGVLALNATNYIGLVRGLETFSQLITATPSESSVTFTIQNIPVTIQDSPRLAHRGLMVDTSRHFIAKEKLYQVMDGMLSVKLNVFHWHITDSDSFPIYLPSRPNLSKFGAFSAAETYSAHDVKDIVDYAILRGIRVVPEIDSPAHTRAMGLDPDLHDKVTCADAESMWVRGVPFGQLNPTLDGVYEVFSDIFQDLKSYFPWDTLHLGCEEVYSRCWNTMQIAEFRVKNNISDYKGLFNYYIDRIRPMVSDRKKVYWTNQDTLYLNFTLDETLQWWGKTTDLVTGMNTYPNNKYILSNSNALYLDCGAGNIFGNRSWCDPYHTWLDIYYFEPSKFLNAEQLQRVVGLEAALWSEINDGSSTLNKIFPRTNSMAERAWSPITHNFQANYTVFVRLNAWRSHIGERGIDIQPLTTGYCERNPEVCFL